MIPKEANNKSNFKYSIFFADSARACWKMALQSIPKGKILLPAYIGITDREGSGIFDPVSELNREFVFYKLNNDLSIDVNNFKAALHQKRISIVLLVHYFGFKIQNIKEIVTLCREQNIIVVEDCAHLYNFNNFELSDAGKHGDFAFYSLHKNFPFENGGMLLLNNKSIELIKKGQAGKFDYSFDLMSYDTKKIAEKRIENYNYLLESISDVSGLRPLKGALKNGDIPHNLPVIIESGLREKLYFWLLNNEITLTALYYRLIDPLSTPNYEDMQYISNNILNLPVHQDIDKEDMDRLLRSMDLGIKELI